MKLANIYADVSGVRKGQAATGTSDSNCIDVRAYSGGILRDISKVVSVDSNGVATVISRRLVTTSQYKYVTGQLSCPDGKSFNSNSQYSTCQFKVELEFKLDSIGKQNMLFSDAPSSTTYYKIFINQSNHLQVSVCYNGGTVRNVTWTDWTFAADTWYKLSYYLPTENTSNYKAYASINGSAYVSKTVYTSYAVATTRNVYLSSAGNSLRGDILVMGTSYNDRVQHTYSVSVNNAIAGQSFNLTSNNYTFSGGTVYSVGSSSWIE